MSENNRAYLQKEVYSIDIILSLVDINVPVYIGKKKKVELDGDLINMASDRYKTFKTSGTNCVYCGLEGKFFRKEKAFSQDTESWHLNLYGYDEDGKEVMLTKDHIVPKSKGGKNNISNYQTLCYKCNREKKDSYPV